jgi:hypothetical protein
LIYRNRRSASGCASERAQLTSMGLKARDATGCEEITVLTNGGNYNGDEVMACEGSGVCPAFQRHRRPATPSVASSPWLNFIYDAENTATAVRPATT